MRRQGPELMTSISAALFHSSLRMALPPHPCRNHLTPPLGFSTETRFSPPSGTVTTGTLTAAPQKATNQHLLPHGHIELTVTGIKSICQERLLSRSLVVLFRTCFSVPSPRKWFISCKSDTSGLSSFPSVPM